MKPNVQSYFSKNGHETERRKKRGRDKREPSQNYKTKLSLSTFSLLCASFETLSTANSFSFRINEGIPGIPYIPTWK